VPCTRADALAIEAEDNEAVTGLPHPPVLSTCEIDETIPLGWRLDAIFDHEPESEEIEAVLALVAEADPRTATLDRLPDTDWVTQSQSGLDPITAGRFHIVHERDASPLPGHVNFIIPASRAFGTGQHETTHGCLRALDAMARSGHRFGNIADIGTGTGLLAFAALSLWPQAHALASDIDPVAIDVTAENAALNNVETGSGAGALALVAAPGIDDPLILGLAPYDLVIANILAGPLITLAPGICAQIAEGGSLVLAGLLATQADAVLAAYRRQGMRLAARHDNGDWPTLHLRKRHRHGWRRETRWRADAHGTAPGFGSW
jgi:ribosomal protein L11 methyltransferase